MLLSLLRNFCSGVPVIHLLYVLKINSTPSTAALLHCLHRPVSFLWAPVASFYLHLCLSRMLAKAALGKALGLVPPPLPRQFCDFSRANPVTSNTSVFYLPGWLNRLEVTAGARLREAWRRSPALDPGSPGPARPTVRSPQLPPLHPQPRLCFLPAFLAPGFPKACGQTPPPAAPGSVWGAASPTWPPLGGYLGDRDPPALPAAGSPVGGRPPPVPWARTCLGRQSDGARREPRGARLSAGAAGRWALATPSASLAPCLSGAHLPLCPSSRASLESPLPRPPPPQPASLGPAVGRLRCHSALPGRSHAARALGCERIKPARAEPPARACGLSGVFQRLLRPGALLQTGLGAPASRKVCGKWI